MSSAWPALVPILSDEHVRLRPHGPADVPRIVEQANDPRSRRWTTVPMPYDASHGRAFLEIVRAGWDSGERRFWAIEVDGAFAGTVNYTRRVPGTAEIGFGLHPDARGRSVATRAVRLVLEHAFAHDGVRTMTWRAAAGNLASWQAAWANGFVQHGTWPAMHANGAGQVEDLWIASVRAGDPRRPRRPWWEAADLEGERVRLRPWRPEDAPTTWPDEQAELYNEGMAPTPENFADWRSSRLHRMSVGQGVFWCIADAGTDQALGGIQVQRLDVDFTRGTGLIGYWLHPHARGRGALQDALELLVPHAFAARTDDAGRSGLGLHRLQAGTDEDNRASQRVLRRAGFRECATERAVIAHEDRPPTGALTFELLDTDDRVAQTVEPAIVPVLETGSLRLRPWTPHDRPSGERDLDRDSLRFMPAGAQPTAGTYDAWFARGERQRDRGTVVKWCIADRATDAPLGAVMVFGIGAGAPGDAELGYWLYADARGRGHLREAIPAVLDHAFAPLAKDGLGLRRLRAVTDLENVASQRLLERHGFHRWGESHGSFARADASVADAAHFELLADGRASLAPAGGVLVVPVLDGERARLRPWRDEDVPRIVQWCADATTRHWLAGLPDPYTDDAARAYVRLMRRAAASGTTLGWCIADPRTDLAVGSVSVMDLRGEDRTAGEVGYWIHPDARGTGVATEAVGLALSHAFTSTEDCGLGRRRLRLNVAAGNDASAAIARRHGFTHVGTDRLAEPLGDGSYADLLRFDLLQAEWSDRS
ncbi:GNAT family N-acetyltransferase [Luteipulveratus flavus]|uniref:GNAT family N-acetyltransferase n=1 Tax=Luteipulveratus flavus TaxID=3031728 RepID=A0ABT6C3M1_9MICO|nr:GNAT family N-acetyltransferase [Luteipulveratus sp. YIM 133296]MDF8262902.1 GNAT family N-acetyltransferase [Luteipulveratus sp. YIM 133296]